MAYWLPECQVRWIYHIDHTQLSAAQILDQISLIAPFLKGKVTGEVTGSIGGGIGCCIVIFYLIPG
jgi:hypothetical protein